MGAGGEIDVEEDDVARREAGRGRVEGRGGEIGTSDTIEADKGNCTVENCAVGAREGETGRHQLATVVDARQSDRHVDRGAATFHIDRH